MRTFALCLIALIAVANAASLQDKYPMDFSKKRSFLALLTQVEAKLKSGGPLDTVNKLLDDFKAEITEEQVTHDNLYRHQQEECSGETEFRDQEIADATGAFNAATETLQGCQQQFLRAQGDFAITKRQLQENRNYLATIDDQRRREADNWQQLQDWLEGFKAAVEQCIFLLEEYQAGEGSFVQIVKHTNGMLKQISQLGQVKHIKPLLKSLLQMSSKQELDDIEVNRLKTVLSSLRDHINDQYETAYNNEQESIAAYTEDRARVEDIVENLEDNKQSLEEEQTRLTKCVVAQTGIVNAAAGKRDRNQQLLDDADELCGSIDSEYETGTASRKREMKLLNALRERVEARFGQISEDVNN